MPMSRAASRFCTTASIAVPQRVRRDSDVQRGGQRQADDRDQQLQRVDAQADAADARSASAPAARAGCAAPCRR